MLRVEEGTAVDGEATAQHVPQVRADGCGQRPPQPLTVETLLSATSVIRGRSEQNEVYLARLTHLQLQGLRLGPTLEKLHMVPNVYCLYAYDNLVSSLVGLQHMRRLETLYLQNNRLTDMIGLEGLSSLRKLHLGHNRITRIEHLDGCKHLEELIVPHQRPSGTAAAELEFCPRSMDAIGPSLRVLDVGNNNLEDISSLVPLQSLYSLDLSHNKLRQFQDIRDVLGACEGLTRVQLHGNPFAAGNGERHRAAIVLLARGIEEIDSRAVLPQERDFRRRLEQQKQKLEAQRQRHKRATAYAGDRGSPVAVLTATKGPSRLTAPPMLQELVGPR